MTAIIKNIDKKIELNGNHISYRSLASYHMPMHDHEALQILIPMAGSHYEITWCLEDKTTESKPLGVADICIIPPYLEHEVRWTNAANLINLYITSQYINDHMEGGFDAQQNIIEARIGFDDQMLYPLAHSIRHYFEQSKTLNRKYCDAILTVVSQHIVSNYLRNETDNQVLFNDFSQIPCAKIREAILFTQNNLDRNLTVQEIADSVAMSHYHFMRTFKEMIGMPPSKFHMMQRIEKAKEMLSRGERIIDVAMALGFSSQSHFSHVFVRSVGTTPRQFANH